MVFAILAKCTVGWTARTLGCSDSTASSLANAAKWGVAIATLDVGSVIADSVLEGGVEALGDGLLDQSGKVASDGGGEAAVTAREYMNVGAAEETFITDEWGFTEEEISYAHDCPPLSLADTQAYERKDEFEDDARDGSNELEEVLRFMAMAKKAHSSLSMKESMADEYEDFVVDSEVIQNVINPTHLFGGVGKTDTEVHVSILGDGSVAFAFRGTEPTEWTIGFPDVLTDLAQWQKPVRLYDRFQEKRWTI